MKNLEDLRKRKETLRKEIAELEDIAAFKNPKESLSAITHGFTDQFLVDKTDENGEHRLKLKPAEILSFATGGASENYIKTNIYLAPFVLKFLREKLEEYEEREVLKSLEEIL